MENEDKEKLIAAKIIPLLVIVGISALLWFIEPPEGLTLPAFHTAIIFVAMIAAIITNTLPMGAIALTGVAIYALLRAGGEESAAEAIGVPLSALNNLVIWMIVIAFLIARSFSKTGLGRRIALLLLGKFGKSTLHVAYCLGVADFFISPITPSNAARAAIISPIADALAKVINSKDRKLGQYFISSTSAMNDASSIGCMTGAGANIALLGISATVLGIELSFSNWLQYLLLPALFLLLTIPYILYKVIGPQTRATPEAKQFAQQELDKIGPLTMAESKLLLVFIALLVMWVGGQTLGIHTTTAAITGLSLLLLTGVLNWEDVKTEKGAWDTLIWLGIFVGMAKQLQIFGFIDWVGNNVASIISAGAGDSQPIITLSMMMAFYMCTAYFFASATARIIAVTPIILQTLVILGISPMIALLSVAGIGCVASNLTAYSHVRNSLLMGYGYHTSNEWMKIGLVIAGAGSVIFMTTGMIWWQVLGV